jgi:hypothetical protein
MIQPQGGGSSKIAVRLLGQLRQYVLEMRGRHLEAEGHSPIEAVIKMELTDAGAEAVTHALMVYSLPSVLYSVLSALFCLLSALRSLLTDAGAEAVTHALMVSMFILISSVLCS